MPIPKPRAGARGASKYPFAQMKEAAASPAGEGDGSPHSNNGVGIWPTPSAYAVYGSRRWVSRACAADQAKLGGLLVSSALLICGYLHARHRLRPRNRHPADCLLPMPDRSHRQRTRGSAELELHSPASCHDPPDDAPGSYPVFLGRCRSDDHPTHEPMIAHPKCAQ